jgi:hypothetical protein
MRLEDGARAEMFPLTDTGNLRLGARPDRRGKEMVL